MNVTERPVVFDCEGETLLGIVSTPGSGEVDATAVVVVVGGPQYRAGSHRQFVLLARSLAAQGHAVLRFDVRGMGDSSGESRSFEDLGADVAAAIDALHAQVPGLSRVVLWGLCDGASAALLYLSTSRDRRVGGLVLLNPWVRSEASLARTHVRHYYLQRLRQPAFWRKLLGGKVAFGAVRELARNVGTGLGESAPAGDAPYQQRMSGALARFDGPVALFLSGNDYTAREFSDHAAAEPQWKAALAVGQVTRVDFEAADHTFSDDASRAGAEAATVRWLSRFAARDSQVEARTSP